MPAEKELTKLVPKIYKCSYEEIALFAFVKAQQMIIPKMTIDQCIKNYVHFMKIDEDEWGLDSMRTTYCRLQEKYYK